jgi:hypothetical protein
MVQAAARGVVDFSTADLLDRRWWMKLWWLLDQVENDNVVFVRRMEHAHNAALLQYGLDEKVFDLHWDGATTAMREVWDALFPWCKMDATSGKAVDKLHEAWVKRWGDPNSPETLKKIQLTVDYLKGMRSRADARSGRKTPRTIVRRHSQEVR